MNNQKTKQKNFVRGRPALLVLIAIVVAIVGSYKIAYANNIFPRVSIGTVSIGGLTREEAQEKLQTFVESFDQQSISIDINGQQESIELERIGFSIAIDVATEQAWRYGRTGTWYANLRTWLTAPFRSQRILAGVVLDDGLLEDEIATLAALIDQPGKDVRLYVNGTAVQILTDTNVGKVIDQAGARELITQTVQNLQAGPVVLQLIEQTPHADPASAEKARMQAERIIRQPLTFEYQDGTFVVSRDQLGSWITSEYGDDQLTPGINKKLLSAYIASIAQKVNRVPQQPKIAFTDGRVSEFVPPRNGQAVAETKLIEMVLEEVAKRAQGDVAVRSLILPMEPTKPAGDLPGIIPGIVELIGTATTPFTGSPANRISNIKNGVRFLTGVLIAPGEEFSTLKTLGTVDNTTGYLPELVIKGDRTTPEFGGGLCQVSTTLFRAVMNSALPITARRNHSYRVSYYEKDGLGNRIGPGLDATIYEPDPDFKFVNDTKDNVLIYGYTSGTKITFELYGTKDGRKSEVIGPKLLTETAPGEPIYEETDALPPGVKKQVETAHPGGSAWAKYTITYADGKKWEKEYTSWYRRWPARYLVGRAPGASPSPAPSVSPVSSPATVVQ